MMIIVLQTEKYLIQVYYVLEALVDFMPQIAELSANDVQLSILNSFVSHLKKQETHSKNVRTHGTLRLITRTLRLIGIIYKSPGIETILFFMSFAKI